MHTGASVEAQAARWNRPSVCGEDPIPGRQSDGDGDEDGEGLDREGP